MQRVLRGVLFLAIGGAVAGCQTEPSRGPGSMAGLERRAAMIRGTADNQWEAVEAAIERGDTVHPRYVYQLADIRYAALAIEVRTAMLRHDSSEQREAEEAIAKAEKALPSVLAAPMSEPLPVQVTWPRTPGG